jgi:isoquinoline 1-oxidoreductase beta subunit
MLRAAPSAPKIKSKRADLSRRAFLTASVAAGGGLLLALKMPFPARSEAFDASSGEFNAFVRIDPAGKVHLVMPYIEMGQGTYTSVSMLIAEELEVDLDQVQYEHAPPNDKFYANPLVGFQATGGSTAIRASWEPLRKVGAGARMMLVSAAANEWQVDPEACRAEKGEVIHGQSGRRLSYGALAEKAAALPVPSEIPLKPRKDFRLIGKPVKRLDSPAKVDGTAMFGIDAKVPGMKIATVAACPVFGGKLSKVDDSKAMAVNGVHQVVRLDDAVAVVANHMGAAKKGLAALDIQWDEGPNATLSTADIVSQLEAASQNPGAVARNDGDVDKAMASANTKIEAIYQQPFLAHTTMEPVNCTVHVRKDACDIWVGIQVMTRAQAIAATITGLPAEKVTVHNHLLGGGFGRRLEVDFIAQAVKIAKQVEGPVKVIWTREEDIQHDMYRPYFFDRINAGLDAEGKPVAWHHRITGPSVLARWAPPTFTNGFDFDTVDGAAEPPYSLPNILVDYVRHEPPGIPTGNWRSVGPSHNIFVVESFIDELAASANKDPVEYRLDLLEAVPRAKAVLELAAEKAGWGQTLPKGSGRGVSVQTVFGTYMSQVAEVEVSKGGDVAVRRVVCAVDCGIAVNPDTIEAQIQSAINYGLTAALHGEITLKNGRVEQSNFDNYRALHIDEAPMIEVYIVDSDEAPGGIGEPGTSALFPAVTNAIFAATGVRVRKLPIDPALLNPV